MAWAYILECSDGSFYVGSTHDLSARLQEHHDGKATSCTRRRRPVRLRWSREFEAIGEAFVVEQQLKGWSRAKKIALMEGRYGDLPGLSTRGGPVKGFGGNPEAKDFETSPLDALAKRGQREWTPRAVTRHLPRQ